MTFNLSPDRQADRDDAWTRADEAGDGIARTWLYIVGVALLAAGLVGFVDNPIVSRRGDALFQVDTLHSVVLLVTGLVALFIGASPARSRPRRGDDRVRRRCTSSSSARRSSHRTCSASSRRR